MAALAAAGAALADPPLIKAPPDQAVEATGPSGAVVVYPAPVVTKVGGNTTDVACSPASGSTFPLGTTTVTCTATDTVTSESQSVTFSVTVSDGTPPALSLPSGLALETSSPAGAAATYTASASDLVDGAVAVSCAPASGTVFAVGVTIVSCSSADSRGNTATGSFSVTVVLVDSTPPSISAPVSVQATASAPDGADVSFSVSAVDALDGPVTPVCTPGSGSRFPVGTTLVSCTAVDSHGNASSASFPVVVTFVDTTPPTLSLPAPMSIEATGPGGAVATFTPTAIDNVDGAVTPQCQPSSGSTFELGRTTVTCRATDTRNNEATGSFAVDVVDTTPPEIVVPAGLRVEANGAAGARVPFAVDAVDAVDGPIVPTEIACSPASGSMFPLGSTQVSCSARDQRGNGASRGFVVTVVDSTPPSVVAPAPLVLVSSSPVPADDPRVRGFLGSAHATDLVDPAPRLSADAPAVLPLGTTSVTFTASDASGNRATATSTIRVVEQMPSTPPVVADRTPPANVRDLRAEAGNLRVRLRWALPGDSDLGRVEVQRSPNVAEAEAQTVFSGVASTFVDRALVAGEAYRYVVVAYDRTGNRSAGVAIVVVARETALVSPLDGARLSGPPRFQWTRARGAAFYNLQLFRGTRKVLSVWPRTTAFRLTKTWKFAGRRERLTAGTYHWYVWPATSRSAYGRLHVSGSFSVR